MSANSVIQYAVNYDVLDPVKRMFQEFAATTKLPEHLGVREFPDCRGESVHIVEVGDFYIGSLIEGLGTRGLVADAVCAKTGVSHYSSIGRSAAAAILNDLATSGIQPVVCHMYLSAGSNEVFADRRKMAELGVGWAEACMMEEALWGGGEMPMVRDLVFPGAFEIAGSVWGIMRKPQRPIHSANIKVGDKIIGIASSGPHDNGLTLVRDIKSEKLQELGYQTLLSGGKTFGEALLRPTVLYGPFVRDCLLAGVQIHSAINITGHGFAKIGRAKTPFHYEIENLPEPDPVFSFIKEHSGLSIKEMYGKFNMGMGFVLIIKDNSAYNVLRIADLMGHKAWIAGTVKEAMDDKMKVTLPNGVNFTEENLAIRA